MFHRVIWRLAHNTTLSSVSLVPSNAWMWISFMNMNVHTSSGTHFKYECDCFQLFGMRTRLFYIIHIHEWCSCDVHAWGARPSTRVSASEPAQGGVEGRSPRRKVWVHIWKCMTPQGNDLQLLRSWFGFWRSIWPWCMAIHTHQEWQWTFDITWFMLLMSTGAALHTPQ